MAQHCRRFAGTSWPWQSLDGATPLRIQRLVPGKRCPALLRSLTAVCMCMPAKTLRMLG